MTGDAPSREGHGAGPEAPEEDGDYVFLVRVQAVPFSCTEEDVLAFFESAGEVQNRSRFTPAKQTVCFRAAGPRLQTRPCTQVSKASP